MRGTRAGAAAMLRAYMQHADNLPRCLLQHVIIDQVCDGALRSKPLDRGDDNGVHRRGCQ